MKLTDIKLEDKILYRLKINYITMQFAIFFKTTAEHKSQQQSKLYNIHMYNMLKCIKYYENINLKLATGDRPIESYMYNGARGNILARNFYYFFSVKNGASQCTLYCLSDGRAPQTSRGPG